MEMVLGDVFVRALSSPHYKNGGQFISLKLILFYMIDLDSYRPAGSVTVDEAQVIA